MKRSTLLVLSTLLCLTVIVITFLSVEYYINTGKPHRDIGNNFQQVVHGVGIGATAKPTWCYINFDPRIDPRCTCIEWPIPGGYCYCPDHTGTVSYIAGNIEMGVTIETAKMP